MSRYISAFVFAVCIIAVLGTFATIAQTPAKGQVPTFQPDPSWPAIPNNWVFGEVSSVSVDSRDHIWILQRPATIPEPQRANAAPPVLEFDAAGKFIQGDMLLKFTTAGKFLLQVGH